MTAIANPTDAAQAYFAAWNRRDPAGIVATFVPGGTYSDPSAGEQLTGDAIAAYAAGLFTAFPDLQFDIGTTLLDGGGVLVAEWMMRGTNTGPLGGGPPTGGTIALPGMDLIAVQDGRVESVRGFFDRETLLEQLGLQVIVRPFRLGPVSFGASVRLETADCTMPGAMALTMIDVRDEGEADQVREQTRRIMPELAQMKGFLGMTALYAGTRLYTITAWQTADDSRQLHGSVHAESVRKVFGGEIGTAGCFGVWVPQRVLRRVRCTVCGRWEGVREEAARCECGEELPKPPPVW